jgi:hypothetical protein
MSKVSRSDPWFHIAALLQVAVVLYIVVGMTCPRAWGQATGTSTQPAGPVPALGPAPPYDLFTIDSSSQMTVEYSFGPSATPRVPVINGSPSAKSKLVINSVWAFGLPETANAYVTVTIGKSVTPFASPTPKLSWDQGKGQYTADNKALTDFASSLVAQINNSMPGLDAKNPIEPVVAKLKLILPRTDATTAPDVNGSLTILFQPIPAATAAQPIPADIDQQQATTDQQQSTIKHDQVLVDTLQPQLEHLQTTIAAHQEASNKQQIKIDEEQAETKKKGKAEPNDAKRWIAGATQQVAGAQQQVETTTTQVAITELQVSRAQQQVNDSSQQFNLANKQIASGSPAQKTKAEGQAKVAQEQNQKAQQQDHRAQLLNVKAQRLNDVAQKQNDRAQRQAAFAQKLDVTIRPPSKVVKWIADLLGINENAAVGVIVLLACIVVIVLLLLRARPGSNRNSQPLHATSEVTQPTT